MSALKAMMGERQIDASECGMVRALGQTRRPRSMIAAGTEFRLAAYTTLVTRDFSRSKNRAVTNQVPLGRYFLFVGGLLLGMLFIADWYLPSASSQTFFRETRVDKSIIRIKSAHKWPEAIVFDTSPPTIVPPPMPILAKAPVINQPKEALAQLNSPLPKASEYRAPVRVKRKLQIAAPPRLNMDSARDFREPKG